MWCSERKWFVLHIPIYEFDKSTPWQGQELDNAEPQTKRDKQDKPHASLCCARCRHPVTSPQAAIERNGSHFHVFTNPGGYTFEIRLFDAADCARQGMATTEYTWFAGFAWQHAVCRNCHMQLGWVYSQPGVPDFFGLIADRLTQNHG